MKYKMDDCEIVANTLQPRQACAVELAAKKVTSTRVPGRPE